MGFHTFDPDSADRLEDDSRYRYLSREELLSALGVGPSTRDADRPLGRVADLGSGTGFYTDDVAPFADEVRAVDVQPEMHDRYREKGVPDDVVPVTSDVADLPFPDGDLDAAFSTMTFHEFAGDGHDDGARPDREKTDDALAEVARVLREGGRFAVADWTADGDGESGPPVAERYDRDEAVALLAGSGFEVVRADERPETFLVVARA